jgi:hypothetical protein
LSILEDLADKVHGLLLDFRRDFLPFNGDNGANYNIGGCYIRQQHIVELWWYQHGQGLEILLEFNKSRRRLIIPLEFLCLL